MPTLASTNSRYSVGVLDIQTAMPPGSVLLQNYTGAVCRFYHCSCSKMAAQKIQRIPQRIALGNQFFDLCFVAHIVLSLFVNSAA